MRTGLDPAVDVNQRLVEHLTESVLAVLMTRALEAAAVYSEATGRHTICARDMEIGLIATACEARSDQGFWDAVKAQGSLSQNPAPQGRRRV